jgi:hypothetical protein
MYFTYFGIGLCTTNSDGLNEVVIIRSVALYSEAYVDPAQLVEGTAECDSGELYCC